MSVIEHMVASLQVKQGSFHYQVDGDNGWWMGTSSLLRQMRGWSMLLLAGVVLMVQCQDGVDEFWAVVSGISRSRYPMGLDTGYSCQLDWWPLDKMEY